MNNSDERITVNLTERLKRIRISAIQPVEIGNPHRKQYSLKQMTEEMRKKAEEHERDFLDDIFHLIILYYTSGTNNIDKLLEEEFASNEAKESATTLRNVYGINNNFDPFSYSPTLSKVSEAFPHLSLVLVDMLLNNSPGKLRTLVNTRDLGAKVNIHFKMNYFPYLLLIDSFNAQIALLVYHLCHSKGILNTNGAKDIVHAFQLACKMYTKIETEECLAPESAMRKFTEYITETLSFDAASLNILWNHVIGTKILPIYEIPLVTDFHREVLKAQPLNLQKWRQLLSGNNNVST